MTANPRVQNGTLSLYLIPRGEKPISLIGCDDDNDVDVATDRQFPAPISLSLNFDRARWKIDLGAWPPGRKSAWDKVGDETVDLAR